MRVLKTCATFPRARRCILKLGMAQRVARLITLNTHTKVFLLIRINGRRTELTLCASGCVWFAARGSMFLPEASRVERLSALQTSRQVLKVIRELLVLPELNHIVEVLHMLDNCVQLENRQRGGVSAMFKITVRAWSLDRWGQ